MQGLFAPVWYQSQTDPLSCARGLSANINPFLYGFFYSTKVNQLDLRSKLLHCWLYIEKLQLSI